MKCAFSLLILYNYVTLYSAKNIICANYCYVRAALVPIQYDLERPKQFQTNFLKA